MLLRPGRADPHVEAAPYALLERQPRRPLAGGDWEQILDWLREKALALVRLAQPEPRVVGTRCPFCDFILPAGQLLNGLLGAGVPPPTAKRARRG